MLPVPPGGGTGLLCGVSLGPAEEALKNRNGTPATPQEGARAWSTTDWLHGPMGCAGTHGAGAPWSATLAVLGSRAPIAGSSGPHRGGASKTAARLPTGGGRGASPVSAELAAHQIWS